MNTDLKGAADAAPEPITVPAPTITVKSEDPNLSGEVTFKIPTLYEQVAIERRMTELANVGAAPNTFMRYEWLTNTGQFLVEAVATLEHVIVTAPRGFYESTPRGPELAVGRLSSINRDVLIAVYEGYRAYRSRFRTRRGGDTQGAIETAGSEVHSDSSPQDRQQPA